MLYSLLLRRQLAAGGDVMELDAEIAVGHWW